MKRIVVTGAKGGTGRSIVKVLREAGYEVSAIDVKPVEPTDAGYAQVDLLTDPGLCDVLAGAAGVVHFGSLPHDALTSRATAFRNVMLGGFNIFHTCAMLGIKRIAHASSIMVYGDFAQHRYLPADEHSPLSPISEYGSAKAALERVAADICRWHGMSIAAFRLGRIVYENSYDWRLKRHTESNASAREDLWTYVDARDVARACQLWLESDIQGFRAFNIAAADVCLETPTRELVREFYPQMRELRADFAGRESPFSSAALQSSLGWKAQWNWRQLRDGA